MSANADIVIVGGGPVGATLLLALRRKGIAATLLEARERGAAHHDQRALALSYGSCVILQRLGIWQKVQGQATAINTIHISQRGSMGRSRLQAEEHGLPALGYVLAYGALNQALDEALHATLDGTASPDAPDDCTASLIYGAQVSAILPEPAAAQISYHDSNTSASASVHAKLAILADGGRTLADIPGLQREAKQYGHDALVSKVSSELPHANVAYERFTPMGPIALLPNGPREFSLVWTGEREAVQRLLQLDDAQFLGELHQHFGDRVGKFLRVDKRISFPLQLSYLKQVKAPHLVVIGNAAQTMHPVAGQGFNVGLRDAWELAELIQATPAPAWGDQAMLKRYQKTRLSDAKRNLLFTDFLVNIFSNDMLGLSAMRGMGLGLLDIVQPAKQHLIRKMSFGSHG